MIKMSTEDIVHGKVFANKKGQTRLIMGWVECLQGEWVEYIGHKSKLLLCKFSALCRWVDHEVPEYQHQSELGRCPCCSSLFTIWHWNGHCAWCFDCHFVSPSFTHVTGEYRPATKKQALEMWRWLQGVVGLWFAHQPIQTVSPGTVTATDAQSTEWTFDPNHKPEVTWL